MAHFEQNPAQSIRMKGAIPLNGRVRVQGSKNAALPIIAASILIHGKSTIRNCPRITDADCMLHLIECAGAKVCINEPDGSSQGDIVIDASDIFEGTMPSRYVVLMRSSIILMGALIGRLGSVCIDYPGGCVIGRRPIDLHLYGLEKLGADIRLQGNRIYATADCLTGSRIVFPFSSVGATQNVILAAVYAKGTTIIENASREPEIISLCEFLNRAGADIILDDDFIKHGLLVIRGVDRGCLRTADYTIVSDRIVAGTYLFAGLAAGGDITLENTPYEHMESVCGIVRGMGGRLTYCEKTGELKLKAPDRSQLVNPEYVETAVYPGFPTDLQSQLMAASCVCRGKMTIKENIFSNRFKVVEELRRMGADITLRDHTVAVVNGGASLEGRNVIASELRGGAALVIAGSAAGGITSISDIHYINRGYQDIAGDFARLGARIIYD